MQSAPELSVVLVNHNGARCLPGAPCSARSGHAEPRVECIVVDSGSTDGSWEDIERHWPTARELRFEENIGFCAGCNRGAEAASGRLLAFVNFDGRVEPGWDAPLRTLLDDDPGISVATGICCARTARRSRRPASRSRRTPPPTAAWRELRARERQRRPSTSPPPRAR